jgi:hypothetical protein
VTGDATAAAVSAPVSPGAKQPLDDIMLAMDVVDTLRRRERLVQHELDELGREEDLKERLRKIYKAQGIDVPDHVIEQGVAALREERFVYKPPPPGLRSKLARWYVRRDRWGKWVLGGIAAALTALGINYFAVVAPNAALPRQMDELYAQVLEIATTDDAKAIATNFLNAGKTAVREDSKEVARDAVAALTDLRTALEQEYTLRIVNRPGEKTGVWRIPDVNEQARNYYLIVEGVDAGGKVLTVPIESEETGRTERVTKWGLRVQEDVFNAVAADKQDDGIIEKDRFGYKKRGHLVPEYEMPTTGGAITAW